MNYPTDLKYSKTHEWVKEDDGLTVVGISDFAQDSLGDIVFIGLPSVGDTEMKPKRALPNARRIALCAGPSGCLNTSGLSLLSSLGGSTLYGCL